MSQSDFLRKTLLEKIRHIYENGIFIADTVFNKHKVNLVLVGGNCFEMFVNPNSLDITSIQPLDHRSVRMKRYGSQLNPV